MNKRLVSYRYLYSQRRLSKIFKRAGNFPSGINLLRYTHNKLLGLFLKLIKSKSVAYPGTIMLELSSQCNLRCTICPGNHPYGESMDRGFMPKEKAFEIINQLWPYLDSIGLSGMGETFLYEDLETIVDYIRGKNKGIVISVSTNAVTPDCIEITKKLKNKIDTIQVSIDGLNEVYEKIRKGSSFITFSANLIQMADILRGSKTHLMLNMVVNEENFTQMLPIARFAHNAGISFLDFTLINLAGLPDVKPAAYDFLTSHGFLHALKELIEEKENFDGMQLKVWNPDTERGFKSCPFPWTHFYISWNGFLLPCCAKPFPKEQHFGNAFEQPLKEILNKNKYKDFRQNWFEDKTPTFCRNCHYTYFKNKKNFSLVAGFLRKK